MSEEQKSYCVVQKTDPDLLLALATITEAIKDLKKEPQHEPQLYEMEACNFPGEKEQPWWITILYLILFVLCIFSFYCFIKAR